MPVCTPHPSAFMCEGADRQHSRLQALSIKGCQKVSDLAVAAVATNGKLQRLIVNGVPGIGTLTLAALQSHCR